MKIDLVCVGKLKKSFYKAAFEYYLKRARKYFRIDLIEKRKGTLNQLDTRAFSVVLDENGKQISTAQLSAIIEKLQLGGQRSMSFFVGGPLGLDEEFKNSVDMRMSLSGMTLTHELARVMLIEQIYRCGTILAGEKYHK